MFSVLTCAAVLAGAIAAGDEAKPVFVADFNGPNAIVQTGGQGKLMPRGQTQVSIVTDSSLADGAGGFLRVTRPPGEDNGPAGVRFVPDSPDHWLNTWYQDAGNADVLHGSLDLLYRQSTDFQGPSSLRLDFASDTNKDGVRLVITTNGPNMIGVEVVRRVAGEAKLAGVVGFRFKFEANVVYHIAMTLQPGPQPGTTQGRLYIEKAGEPIKPGVTTPTVVMPPFTLDPEGKLSTSFFAGEGTSIIGMANLQSWNKEVECQVDMDRFRVWKGIPAEFGPVQP